MDSGASSKGSIDSLITSFSAIMGQQPIRPQSGRSQASSGAASKGSSGAYGHAGSRTQSAGSAGGNGDVSFSSAPLRALNLAPTASPSQLSSIDTSSTRSPASTRTRPLLPSVDVRNGGTATTEAGPTSRKQQPSHVSEYKMVGDAADAKITPMRVLVVEVCTVLPRSPLWPKLTSRLLPFTKDELVNRTLLQKRLVKDGHEVVLAVHGGDALRLLKTDLAFDLILMVRSLRRSLLTGPRLHFFSPTLRT